MYKCLLMCRSNLADLMSWCPRVSSFEKRGISRGSWNLTQLAEEGCRVAPGDRQSSKVQSKVIVVDVLIGKLNTSCCRPRRPE